MSSKVPSEKWQRQAGGIKDLTELDRHLDAVAGYDSDLPYWLKGDVTVDSRPADKARALVIARRRLLEKSAGVEIEEELRPIDRCLFLFRRLHQEHRSLMGYTTIPPDMAARITAENIALSLTEQIPLLESAGCDNPVGWQQSYLDELAQAYCNFYTKPPIK